MVDTTEAGESKYLTVDLVRNSQSKRIVILGEGKYERTDWGEKLTVPVEIDNKQKLYRPSMDSVKNLQLYGKDSRTWVGKIAMVSLQTLNGKEQIIAMAYPADIAQPKPSGVLI